VVVFMSVATTILAPPMIRWAYRGLPGRRPDEEIVRLG
jgi:hypothetical protein